MLPSPHALGGPPHFDAQIARQILSQCDAPVTRNPQETGLKDIFAVFYRSHFQTDQAAADHYGIPRQQFTEWKPVIEPLRDDADLSATLGGVQQVPGDLRVQGTVYAQAFELRSNARAAMACQEPARRHRSHLAHRVRPIRTPAICRPNWRISSTRTSLYRQPARSTISL